jgi:hypothetical protein
MVVDAWLYQIDNNGESTSFPVSRVMAASAIDSFKNSRRNMNQQAVGWTKVEEWPVHANPAFREKPAVVGTP